jgi:hypothetical protein
MVEILDMPFTTAIFDLKEKKSRDNFSYIVDYLYIISYRVNFHRLRHISCIFRSNLKIKQSIRQPYNKEIHKN